MKVICNHSGCNKGYICEHKEVHSEISDCQEFCTLEEREVECIPVEEKIDGDVLKHISERKIVDYIVLESYSKGELCKGVMNLINQGWELQGGVSGAFKTNSTAYFFQAVIKYE